MRDVGGDRDLYMTLRTNRIAYQVQMHANTQKNLEIITMSHKSSSLAYKSQSWGPF